MPKRINRDRALPVDLFADEAVHETELRAIWQQDWIFATTADAIAEPGDFVTTTIGRQPVIVVRDHDYTIRALSNACAHRGAALVECAGRASRFSCPYHAWTYGLDGALMSVPYAQPDEVDKADLGLAAHRVETWQGLVFVNLDPGASPLADRIEVIDPYVRPLGLDRLHHEVAATQHETWDANWKVVFSNALDSYSNFRVHAETVEPYSPTDASYYLAGSASATVTGGESADRADHLVISLPPSFVAIVFPDSMLWQSLAPLGVGRTRVSTGFAGERVAGSEDVAMPTWDAEFIDEDRRICERLQRSAAASWQPGPLLGLEQAIGDFHEFLAWRLADEAPSGPCIAAAPGERPEPFDSAG